MVSYSKDTQNLTDVVNNCKNQCNNNTDCDALYVSSNRNTYFCNFVKNEETNIIQSTMFTDIQPSSDIISSKLHIKDKKLITQDQSYIIGKRLSTKSDYDKYSLYSIGPTMEEAPPGLETYPGYNQYIEDVNIMLYNTPTVQGFQSRTEGFGQYNYNDCHPTQTNNIGCKAFIQEKKIAPLMRTTNVYSNMLKQMEYNNTNFSKKTQDFVSNYYELEDNSKYQFNPNDTKFNDSKDKKSILETANDDLNELLIQQNNIYIVGTITAATLLITAILLSTA
jgi:hypothetical protein